MQFNRPVLSVENLPLVSTSKTASEVLYGNIDKTSTSDETYQINRDNSRDFYWTLLNASSENLHELDLFNHLSSPNADSEPTAMIYPRLYSNFGYITEI